MRKRTAEKNEYHNIKFRYCTKEDFESRGLKVDKAFQDNIENRLCPDYKKGEEPEFYKVMNKYSDENLRHSFSV